MGNILHPKIKALQRRSAAVSYSNVSVNEKGELQEDDLDKRIVKGYLFTWNNVNDRREMFIKGAFSKSIQERGPGSKSKMPIKFLAYHNRTKPLSLFSKLEENDYGLYFETNPLDKVSYSGDILIGLRSGTLNNFSGGFNPVWNKSKYDESEDVIIHKECSLYEGSVVSLASDEDTYRVRSMITDDEVQEINEDILSFVDKLPKQYKLEARNLFTRQQSLYTFEPSSKTLEEVEEPVKRGIPYKYLTNKFKSQNK